ncbi:MAG: hypothetical protein IPK22_26675 [Verrucomicrobiaceae bacterium]|nr:hypothetical protein [Verrucomicrobiaceae bacterium]
MRTTVFAFLFSIASLTLRGEISVGASLEWLTDTSTSIGTYVITDSRKESDSAFQLSLKVEESLKGKPPQNANSPYWVRRPKGSETPIVRVGDRFLIFLKRDDNDSDRVAHLINLSTSQSGGMESVSINHKFEVLTGQAEILTVVKERIKGHPTVSPTKWREFPLSRFYVEVPMGSQAFGELYGGSTCFLLLPDDLKPEKKSK